MASVVRSPKAKSDLRQILAYLADENGAAAFAWLEEIETLFRLLATQPQMGELYGSRRRREVRRHTFGSYVVYFQCRPDGIEILRIWHAARKPPRMH